MNVVPKIVSILLSLIIGFSVFTIIPFTASAATAIDYIDENGDSQTAKSVTELTSDTTSLKAGRYAVTADTEIFYAGVVSGVSELEGKTLCPPKMTKYLDADGSVKERACYEMTSGSTELSSGWYAVIQIKCKFAFWGDVDLKSIRYAGDEAVTDENLSWMNELAPDANYTQVAEFLMDFHTPEDVGETTFNANFDYTDYQWWLARTADGGWEVVSFGY